MVQSKTAGTVTSATATQIVTAQDKIAQALTQASSQAKKRLAFEGLKLPTQNWSGSVIRNPAV